MRNQKLNYWIRLSLVTFYLAFPGRITYAQHIEPHEVYDITPTDSTLSEKFVEALCKAARTRSGEGRPGLPSDLEALIVLAAGTGFSDHDQPQKSLSWHQKFGRYCHCKSTDEFPAGSFLRQAVNANFREFANIVGPNNRLSLDLLQTDADSLNIFEYINKQRIDIEASHNNKRFEFQQDEKWKNIMFFYFLFSEYRVILMRQMEEGQ
ncbi:hypothetical protein JMN32_02850 [Fulvivirga sp. 29W222]|uniref:Uncharacterized protein n=1 Tax=Fulvivirga marina TaxID=2494733 RepID=A0A937FVQ6_9BACT|nr:hypothetical protein [Fulvivirga marina]MBL6445230.1 hypothetical protein [Fulvivirga marina]